MIEILPEEFNGWLCPILLLLGHIEIIHKDNKLLANGRSIDSLPPLIQLAIDGILGLVTACLGTKHHGDILVILSQLPRQQLVDIQ